MDTTLVLPVRSIRGRDRVLIVDNLLSYLSADKIEKGGPSQQYIELLVRLMHESPSAARVIVSVPSHINSLINSKQVDNFSRLLKLAIKCDDNWDENAVTSGHRHFRWLGRSTAV